MKNKLTLLARILLGLIYFVFGLNGFLNFIPVPTSIPEGAMAFSTAMMATGYFFPVLKATEVISGFLLLSGVAAPLALIILAPITFQIFLFHAFLTPGPENLLLPIVMIVMHILAAARYWSIYRPLFGKGK